MHWIRSALCISPRPLWPLHQQESFCIGCFLCADGKTGRRLYKWKPKGETNHAEGSGVTHDTVLVNARVGGHLFSSRWWHFARKMTDWQIIVKQEDHWSFAVKWVVSWYVRFFRSFLHFHLSFSYFSLFFPGLCNTNSLGSERSNLPSFVVQRAPLIIFVSNLFGVSAMISAPNCQNSTFKPTHQKPKPMHPDSFFDSFQSARAL